MTMSPEEKQVITGIFDRLRQAENMPRDAEAERFIADQIKAQPYAPYVMAQAIHMQEQALGSLQTQMQDMQQQIAQLQGQLAQSAQQPKGFLSGLFGGGAAPQPQPQQMHRPMGMPPAGAQHMNQPMGQPMMAPGQQAAGGPWSRGPQQGGMPFGGQQPGAAPGAGGGFLKTAAAAAVGVAGGMLVASALSNAFGGGSASASPATPPAGSGLEPVNNAVPAPPERPADFGPSAQPASYEDPGQDWGGGGGDWGGDA
jgi:hypothetical protein